MRKIFVILLLVAIPAHADHHRSHAIDFLLAAADELAIVQQEISRYTNSYEPGDALFYTDARVHSQLQNIDNALDSIGTQISVALAHLADPRDASLDLARRSLTQPTTSGEKSAVMQAWIVIYTNNVIRNNTEPGTSKGSNMLGVVGHGSVMWRHLDEAVWHVNDAIREEIYDDPVFICAGPNNHCE